MTSEGGIVTDDELNAILADSEGDPHIFALVAEVRRLRDVLADIAIEQYIQKKRMAGR